MLIKPGELERAAMEVLRDSRSPALGRDFAPTTVMAVQTRVPQ
ncbi:hypothetical protein [Lentzea sp. NEAU-D7]|nr:hypothetical protein [Lentzea sp. NEAU-D7]MCX2946918.1 hypothetical protein [Lentzea sp. NEAU-D7]